MTDVNDLNSLETRRDMMIWRCGGGGKTTSDRKSSSSGRSLVEVEKNRSRRSRCRRHHRPPKTHSLPELY